jgi:hypothetical protein
LAPIEGGRGVIQLEEELMQENLPLWVKNHAFKSMDKQNKQLKYSAIYFFQQTLNNWDMVLYTFSLP